MSTALTGKPSVDKPWMKYYPEFIKNLQVPQCTVREFLEMKCQGRDLPAIHYYGVETTYETLFQRADQYAASLRAVGFQEGDQIPVFMVSCPEFVSLFLAAEKIGASLLCRDNSLEENVQAVKKSGAKTIIAHTTLSQEALNAYLSESDAEKAILLDPLASGNYNEMPEYIQNCYNATVPAVPASGSATIRWDEFLTMGEKFTGEVAASVDIERPLLRVYTSGSTGPSKQVIHAASNVLGVVAQLAFISPEGRPKFMTVTLPPALVAVVVTMMTLPLASNNLLILNPFCDPYDVDLELMRYRPDIWNQIPMFAHVYSNSKRIPADYDLSNMTSVSMGLEPLNNVWLQRLQKFLKQHNSPARVSCGYGSSEVCGAGTLGMLSPIGFGNGNTGVPLPLVNMCVCPFDSTEEIGYNEVGEICISSPSVMLGYDNEEANAKALKIHADGTRWMHTGDSGYITEEGLLYVLTRGYSPRHGGGEMAILPMENLVAEAGIEGMEDEFFVFVPDEDHKGCFLPYLYVVLEDGTTVDDIEEQVNDALEPFMQPVEIIPIAERPFWHFKTNRIGLAKELQEKRRKEKKHAHQKVRQTVR